MSEDALLRRLKSLEEQMRAIRADVSMIVAQVREVQQQFALVLQRLERE